MKIAVTPVKVEEITPLRELHRAARDCQIRHDSFPQRGFSDAYLLQVEGRVAGYGLVANKYWPQMVHEFYPLPSYRAQALPLFRELLAVSQATGILAQTNDQMLILMLYDCAKNITCDTIFFDDAFTTQLPCPGGALRRVTAADREALVAQKLDADCEHGWLIESDGIPVAVGGALFHYNAPYGSVFMEVAANHRRRGYGSYLVQELKRTCYEIGKVPVARCDAINTASRCTMEKAGLLPCCRFLVGEVMT